jgi:ABC-type transporter Mla subunit MlaD
LLARELAALQHDFVPMSARIDEFSRLRPSIDHVLSEFQSVSDSVNRDLIPTVGSLRENFTRFSSATNARLTEQKDVLNSAVPAQKRELAQLRTQLVDFTTAQNDAEARLRSESSSLSAEVADLRAMLTAISAPPKPRLDSVIIGCIPQIMSAFARKTWNLLYRGSRDGFEAHTFHTLCDSQPNTLTIIATPENWIFGGFTPLV